MPDRSGPVVERTCIRAGAFAFLSPPLPPISKGGEWYGLRPGQDVDWLVSAEDVQALRAAFPEGSFRNASRDEGVRIGQHEFSLSVFGCRYESLIVEARQSHAYLVASPKVLWCLKLAAMLCDMGNQKTWHDVHLLKAYLEGGGDG